MLRSIRIGSAVCSESVPCSSASVDCTGVRLPVLLHGVARSVFIVSGFEHTKVSAKVPFGLMGLVVPRLQQWLAAWAHSVCHVGCCQTALSMQKKRDTSLKAVHKARAKQYPRNPDFQPAIKKGKAQNERMLKKLAPRGTGHQLVVRQPVWASWPARKKDAAKSRGTVVTCCLCHEIGTHRGWDSPCVGALGPRSGPQRALWKRLCSSPANLLSILAVWGTTQREVDGSGSRCLPFCSYQGWSRCWLV